jgi:hypothetical protein
LELSGLPTSTELANAKGADINSKARLVYRKVLTFPPQNMLAIFVDCGKPQSK